jgi:hypothetical protein
MVRKTYRETTGPEPKKKRRGKRKSEAETAGLLSVPMEPLTAEQHKQHEDVWRLRQHEEAEQSFVRFKRLVEWAKGAGCTRVKLEMMEADIMQPIQLIPVSVRGPDDGVEAAVRDLEKSGFQAQPS